MLMFKGLWKQTSRRALSAALTGTLLATGIPASGEEKPAITNNSVRVSPALQSRVRDLIEEVSEAAVELDVALDRPKLIRGKKDIVRIVVSNPQIVKIEQIDGRDLEVVGKRPGTTAVTLWMGDPRQSQVLQLMVVVKPGPGSVPAAFRDGEGNADRDGAVPIGERGGEDLEQAVQQQFPRSQIRLLSAADKVLVQGSARDSQEATRILRFIRRNVAEAASAAGSQNPEKLAEQRVVNLLKVRSESQLSLRVQRVEIPRTALRQFSQQFNIQFEQQSTAGWDKPENCPAVAALDAAAFQGYLKVLQTKKTVKILEEPKLVAAPGRAVTLQIRPATPRTGVQPAAHRRSNADEGSVVALVPSLGEKGRIRIEVAAPDSEGVRPVGAEVAQNGAARATELRRGEALVITAPSTGSLRTETAVLLIVTPELPKSQAGEAAPPLVPAPRGRKSAMRRSGDPVITDEAQQSSIDFYVSGPVGFSD